MGDDTGLLIWVLVLSHREQHGGAAGKHLWTACGLVGLHRHDHVRCAAVGRDAHDAPARLPEHDAALAPAQPEWILRRANRHRRTATDAQSLQRPLADRPEGQRLAVRRESWTGDAGVADLAARDRVSLERRHRT